MTPIFSEKPGAHERHLLRQYNNGLFAAEISQDDVIQAQKKDAEEVEQFMVDFRDLVQQSVSLDANAEADVVLKIKEQLDKSYERCAGLAGDQSEIKDMLKRLLKAIMQAMWKGIGQDFQAQSKLEMEEQARENHFALLEQPLIADLLRPDSPIGEDELAPTLLSESAEAVAIAMQLFAPQQQALICKQAEQVINQMDSSDAVLVQAKQRLVQMETLLKPGNQMPS